MIIPAYRAAATLPAVLAALRPQLSDEVEVLVVDSTGPEARGLLERSFPWVRVLAPPTPTLPGRARNLGVRAARGSTLVFLDADAIPHRDWLAALDRHVGPGVMAVAGAVENGTPGSSVGTACYLLEFSEWTPSRRRTPLHAASCNLLVRREAFEQAGGFRDEIWPGEDTILTLPWGRARALQFAAEARVTHLNRTGWLELLHHQYRLGRAFADVCANVDFPHARFSRWPLLLASPMLRFGALTVRLTGQPRLWLQLARTAPVVAIGLAAWMVGVARGPSQGGRGENL